jgi:hypothetical protein
MVVTRNIFVSRLTTGSTRTGAVYWSTRTTQVSSEPYWCTRTGSTAMKNCRGVAGKAVSTMIIFIIHIYVLFVRVVPYCWCNVLLRPYAVQIVLRRHRVNDENVENVDVEYILVLFS